MKKLMRNIALLLLLIVAYYTVFIIFEPNNYFGLKDSATGTDIMATLRAYEQSPQNRIILGDSRMAKFDAAIIEAETASSYANLSYGGASLKEQLDILDYALAQNPDIEQVVFMASFYTLNEGYSHDRMVIRALQNPFIYLTNLGYNINMLTNIYDHLSPNRSVGDAGETMHPDDYTYTTYTNPTNGQEHEMREGMATHLENLTGRSSAWQLNEELLQRLLQTIEACEQNGISFVVVLPPASDEVMLHIVESYGIYQPMQDVLQQLHATDALVLDYEFSNRELLQPNQFFDGFHLDTVYGLPQWTAELFSAIQEAEYAA